MTILFLLVNYFSLSIVLCQYLLVLFFIFILLISIFQMIGKSTIHLVRLEPSSRLVLCDLIIVQELFISYARSTDRRVAQETKYRSGLRGVRAKDAYFKITHSSYTSRHQLLVLS